MKQTIKLKSILALMILLSVSFIAYSQSSVSFKIKNAGLTVNGSFSDFTTDVVYDANAPQNAKFNGTVVIKSVNTGIKMRDEHLVKADYFDAAKFPNMTFTTISVKPEDKNNLSVTGDLVIKGKSKKITFPVKITAAGTKNKFTGEFKINRRDFGVGGSSLLMTDNLTVLLDVTK